MPGPGQDTEDLLIGAANVMAIRVGTRRTAGGRIWFSAIEKCDLRSVDGLNIVSGAWCVNPSLTEVVEIREESLEVHACPRLQFVVQTAGETVARAVIGISTKVFGRNQGHILPIKTSCPLCRFQVVNAAVIAVEGASQ